MPTLSDLTPQDLAEIEEEFLRASSEPPDFDALTMDAPQPDADARGKDDRLERREMRLVENHNHILDVASRL